MDQHEPHGVLRQRGTNAQAVGYKGTDIHNVRLVRSRATTTGDQTSSCAEFSDDAALCDAEAACRAGPRGRRTAAPGRLSR